MKKERPSDRITIWVLSILTAAGFLRQVAAIVDGVRSVIGR